MGVLGECMTLAQLKAFKDKKVLKSRSVPFNFYQNPVTFSYSSPFWDWDRYIIKLIKLNIC